MENFFTLENCKRIVHALALAASLHGHSHVIELETRFELVIANATPRRTLARAF